MAKEKTGEQLEADLGKLRQRQEELRERAREIQNEARGLDLTTKADARQFTAFRREEADIAVQQAAIGDRIRELTEALKSATREANTIAIEAAKAEYLDLSRVIAIDADSLAQKCERARAAYRLVNKLGGSTRDLNSWPTRMANQLGMAMKSLEWQEPQLLGLPPRRSPEERRELQRLHGFENVRESQERRLTTWREQHPKETPPKGIAWGIAWYTKKIAEIKAALAAKEQMA